MYYRPAFIKFNYKIMKRKIVFLNIALRNIALNSISRKLSLPINERV